MLINAAICWRSLARQYPEMALATVAD